jgi:ABC-2 type transport system permease protein
MADRRRASQLRIALGLAGYTLRASLRNKAGLFFSFLFPIIFISIFGLLGNNSSIKIGVADGLNENQPVVQALQKLSEQKEAPVKIQHDNESKLTDDLRQSKVAGYLVSVQTPNGAEVKLVTANGNQNQGAAKNLIQGVVNQINIQAYQQGAPSLAPPVKLTTAELSGQSYNYIDFLLPGQLGFSLLSLATFGVAFLLIGLRDTLVLKRMQVTAAKTTTLLVAIGLGRLVQAVIQAAIIVGVGILLFDYHLAHGFSSFIDLTILSMFGVAAFIGFGILVANIAKDEQSAPIALNLFNLPQFLLSGAFFPTDVFPSWLQPIANNLPLTYLNDAMRDVTLQGKSLLSVWPYLLGLAAWSVVAYFFAAKTFKAE